MPIVASFELKIPELGLDARELVRVTSDAAIAEMRDGLTQGYDAETGEQRPRKADGKPKGFNTGRLADGLRRTSISGGETRASTSIVPPADRESYVEANPGVMTAEGRVGEAIQAASDAYVKR